jgi:hypothetical protein
MTCCTSKKNLLFAAVFTFCLLLLAASSASAQQVTYYDFNTPQANPSQYTYACTPGSATNPLFCLNDGTGTSSNPSFFLDSYPASIDPILSDNPPQPGSYYATQMTNAGSQESSLWFSVPQVVANGFTTWFAFKFTPNETSYATADGLAFVIQNSQGSNAVYDTSAGCTGIGGAGPTALGTGGGCMGYGGIDNSLALEFDTYYNAWDPNDNNGSNNDNHIALQNCGAGLPNSPNHYSFTNPSNQTTSCQVNLGPANAPVPTLVSNPVSSTPGVGIVTLADGNVHQVVVSYSGPLEATPNLLQVFIDPPFNPGTHTPTASAVPVISGTYDITTALNLINSGSANDSAYIGFTSGTGSAFEENELMAWTYTPHTTVTQSQPLQPAGSPTYQPFPFGTHTYGVQYPSGGPSTTGISMTVTANTVSPALFAQLIAGTPFQGSVCQVYDDTGGNCVIYSVSCFETASPQTVVACPAVTIVPNCIGSNATSCINVKTTYNSSETPVTPGFIQGDPFFSQISALSIAADTANFTCTGECSVTVGQTVTVVGAQPTGFNGSYTVTSIAAPNQFTAQTALPTSGTATTAGFLTSSNTQNIFTSWTPQNIDGTTKGTTNQFSDFVFTSQTTNANTQTALAANSNSPTVGQSDLLTATITAFTGTPTGSVLFYAGSNLICTSPVSTVASITTATCPYTPTSSAPVVLSAQYQGDPSHLLSNSNQLSFTPAAATPTITFNPSPATQTYGTPISAGSLDATASFNNTALTGGTFAYTTTINSVANQPLTPGVTVLPVGNYTITATYTPGSSSYTSAYTTAPYSVTQASLTITWPTASAITYGQTLASSTFTGGSAKSAITNATVPGGFAFASPTTAPGAGPQSENVTFTPGDSTDYAPVTSSISVLVNKATPTVTWPTASAIISGQTLASSMLTGGSAKSPITSANVPGGFTFTYPTTAPTATASQSVTFAPGDTTDFNTVIGSVSVTVSASPQVTISPTSLNFGTNIYLGSILVKTVTVTNSGNATLTFSGDPLIAILKGGDSSEFATVNLCPKTLAPGKSCTMIIGFIAGPFYNPQTATLTIKDNAPNSPQTVPVSATVINPVASFSANTLGFGTVKANSATSTKSITLSNPGGTALSITGYAITGTAKGDYSTTTTCTGTLAPKATPCTISVTFKPTAKGSRPATLVVTDNAQNSPQSISLSGTGN